MNTSNPTILRVSNLRTELQTEDGTLHAIRGVDFEIKAGKTLGLVGESGCGKSMTAYSILRLTPDKATSSGEVVLYRQQEPGGQSMNLLSLSPVGDAIRGVRGNDIALIFQEPMTAFSPVHTVGHHMVEALMLHRTKDKSEAREIAVDLLGRVGISNPELRFQEYPHQLSGGMRQRVMIALALSCKPALLIADEPTTALDVTIQAQVLDLMTEFQDLLGMAMLYITHDLGVIAELADEVAVMYLGQVVEHAPVEELFSRPLHPYTDGLMKSIPQLGKASKERLASIEGTVPVPIDIPVGCSFYSRCKRRIEGICNKVDPPLVDVEAEHKVRCFLYPEVLAAANLNPHAGQVQSGSAGEVEVNLGENHD